MHAGLHDRTRSNLMDEAFRGQGMRRWPVGIKQPPQHQGLAITRADSRIDAPSKAHRHVVDLGRLRFQGGDEVVLRALQGGLRTSEEAMPPDDVRRVGIRGRCDSSRSLQLLHAHGEVGFDPFGEHAHDTLTAIGYSFGQGSYLHLGGEIAWCVGESSGTRQGSRPMAMCWVKSRENRRFG
jgi:hypothetical protein